jgi:hypothetical protein
MEVILSLNLASELAKLLHPPRAVPQTPATRRAAGTGHDALRSGGPTADSRPVLQLNALPMTLSPAIYANMHSSANPNGSYASLYAFSQLANIVPTFAEYFSASLNTIPTLYGSLLHGATVATNQPYVDQVFSSARRNFDTAEISNMDGIPGAWYPAYAAPDDWYDTSDPRRFSDIAIDLTGGAGMNEGPYQILKPARANTLLNSGASTPIDPATSLKSVKFRYLEVELNRPWLDFQIFNLGGWFIQGQEAGYFSSGRTDNNNGILPLISTSMLVAINVEVAAQWSAKDQQVLDDATQRGQKISVGPFVLNADPNQANELHLIGWVSRLVPLAPRIDQSGGLQAVRPESGSLPLAAPTEGTARPAETLA